MQVTLEKTGDLEGRVKVEVTQNDYLDKVNKELKEIGRTRVIPGFRNCLLYTSDAADESARG